MTAQIIQFPQEVRDDVSMARHVQKACERRGWHVELQEAISIVQESKNPVRDPALDAMARKIAAKMGLTLKTEAMR
mgnify:CR=1 FL=1